VSDAFNKALDTEYDHFIKNSWPAQGARNLDKWLGDKNLFPPQSSTPPDANWPFS
jgi:hypothetical protein